MHMVHENLTAKDKEDWVILADGDVLYLTALREYGGMTHMRYIKTTVSGLKAGGAEGTIETAVGLGCITMLLPTDAEQRGGFNLLTWLQGTADKNKNFNIMTIIGNVPTCEAVKTWKENMLT